MSNPYQSPAPDFKDHLPGPVPYSPAPAAGSGMVPQVRVVAILNAVQGGLEIAMGLMFAGAGIFFPLAARMEIAANPNRAADDPPEAVFWVMAAVYGGLGLATLTGGILRIAACVQNYRFQGRILGIVSMVAGTASVLSCYCAPSAIAMLIYGLIVFLNPAVTAAFAMRREGYPVDAILAAFSPYPPAYYPPPSAPGGEPPIGG